PGGRGRLPEQLLRVRRAERHDLREAVRGVIEGEACRAGVEPGTPATGPWAVDPTASTRSSATSPRLLAWTTCGARLHGDARGISHKRDAEFGTPTPDPSRGGWRERAGGSGAPCRLRI